MLHHQRPMAVPANQHRDARLGQVPMRMQQQQPLSQQTQQRQPILMGMQPQASGPGRGQLHIKPLLLVLVVVLYMDQSLGASVFTVDEIDFLFAENGCIEGVLVSMPTAPVVAAAAPMNPQMNSNNKNGIASPLLGVTANEGEIAATPGHQKQQLQQQTVTQLNGMTSANNANTTITTLANTKEKTPMCLVNELARFNKIQHQYRLTNEQGPAHKKRFTVTLKLGDEEYSAEGASIKKAQHSAANEALKHTIYKHPPPKTQRNIRLSKRQCICLICKGQTVQEECQSRWMHDYRDSIIGNITPTVELNALAMKRGEPAVYTFMEPSHHHGNHSGAPHNPYLPPPGPPGHNFNYRGVYNQVRGFPNYDQNRRNNGPRAPVYTHYDHMRYNHYGKGPGGFQPPTFMVSLRVGARDFLGEGRTAQAARHDAASKALHQLKSLPLPEDSLQHCDAGIQENGTTCGLENDPNADLKSPISLVHEIALKRNLPVNFEVISEKGPPHMRTFMTKCTVGDKVTTGEGNGKKVSKKRAAEKMLDELRKLPPQSPTNIAASMARLKRKANPGKKKTRNLIKVYQQEQKAEPEYGEDINPISRLIQIQQAKKEREPVYSLLEERGVPRRREFVMEVSIGQHSCTGTGPNKKLAKRAAAEGLLQLLGYSRPAAQPVKPSIKTGDTNQDMDKSRKVTFLEEEKVVELPAGGSSGRQLVPGLLLMADNTAGNYVHTPTKNSGVNLQTTAAIAKELLKSGNSPTAEALAKAAASVVTHKNSAATPSMAKPLLQQQQQSSQTQSSQVVRPKDQLLYLAQLLGFQVQFSDFPKGNHSEFLSLVSLSTDPPQVCHGAGQTTDASHDQAALTALRALSEMGLDSVAPSGSGMKKDGQQGPQGDGLHLTQSSVQKAGSISLVPSTHV